MASVYENIWIPVRLWPMESYRPSNGMQPECPKLCEIQEGLGRRRSKLKISSISDARSARCKLSQVFYPVELRSHPKPLTQSSCLCRHCLTREHIPRKCAAAALSIRTSPPGRKHQVPVAYLVHRQPHFYPCVL
jgi:hypothetical protein